MSMPIADGPDCLTCRHFNRNPDPDATPTCTAFPGGIPEPIWFGMQVGDVDQREYTPHTTPFEGDGGILYEPATIPA